MVKKQKYYVVWKGRQPGIYRSWEACKTQVHGYLDAEYKAFDSESAAEEAYQQPSKNYIGVKQPANPERVKIVGLPDPAGYAVDAACNGSPGDLEYRGVALRTRAQLFHQGPFQEGTNNVGEFLAIVHALALLKQKKLAGPVYSDSETAIGWVWAKKCKTQLARTSRNQVLFDLIQRAETWLKENSDHNPVLSWHTDAWGENPADFGRK